MLPVKASIVIPCYNHGQYLKEALESALRSDFDSYEVIVVDDGSTDESTISVIEELKSQLSDRTHVTFIRQDNQGLAGARNNGIRAARGEYILPLDADNRISPHFLRKAADILDRNPRIGVVYAYAEYIGEKDGLWKFPVFDARRLLLENFVEACSVLRKSVWVDCNGYDPNLRIGYEDWDLWIGAMEKGWKFRLIKEVLFDYRVVKGSMIENCRIPENHRHLIKYICNKHLGTYIKNLGYVVAEKNVTIIEITRYVRDVEASLRHAETDIGNLNSYIGNLEEGCHAKDAYIGNLEEGCHAKDAYIGKLEGIIRERDETLASIYQTKGWRLLEILRRLAGKIGIRGRDA